MDTNTQKTIAVIGLGYVGLPLAFLVERKGYKVIGIDTDDKKVALLNEKKIPFLEKELEGHMRTATNISFTSDFSKVRDASTVIICVPTPTNDKHLPDLSIVIAATKSIAPHLQKGTLVVLESTVNPGVSEEVVLPVLEEESGLKGGTDFLLAHCPERINPGDKKWTVENIHRVVGGLNAESLERAAAFYESVITGVVKRMGSLKEAEAVKVVENSFRDINIAFVNELAGSFARLGIDVVNVIDGAATKPFAFMAHYPGCGVGGHCIPVDPYYLIEYARSNGFQHAFLSLARQINNDMPAAAVARLVDALNEKGYAINKSEVALLGLAYKPNVDDHRESPSFKIAALLKEKGANVRIYDPFVPSHSTVKSLEEALTGARAIVVATAHNEFKTLTPEVLASYKVEVVMDGRNCLPKESFISSDILYKGIGR